MPREIFSDLGGKRKFGRYIIKRLRRILLPSVKAALADEGAADSPAETSGKKSRRIRAEPCGLESLWHFMGTQPHATLVVILQPEHAQPLGCRRCQCNTHAPFGPHATERLRFCPRRQRHVQRCRERSEEHTSELQSRFDLVCRLLLEKKK